MYFKDQFKLFEILKLGVKTFISGLIMFAVVTIIVKVLPISIVNTIIEIIIGAIVYIVMLLIMKYTFFKDLINQVIGGIKSKGVRKEQTK